MSKIYLIILGLIIVGCANQETFKLKVVEWECAQYQIRPVYVPVGKDFELQETNLCVQLVRK